MTASMTRQLPRVLSLPYTGSLVRYVCQLLRIMSYRYDVDQGPIMNDVYVDVEGLIMNVILRFVLSLYCECKLYLYMYANL